MSLFFNTNVVNNDKGCLESFADKCFTPVRYLFNGKMVTIVDEKIIESHLEFPQRSFLKTALAIISLPLAVIFGTIAKLFAMLTKTTRHNQQLLKVSFKETMRASYQRVFSAFIPDKTIALAPPVIKTENLIAQVSHNKTIIDPVTIVLGPASAPSTPKNMRPVTLPPTPEQSPPPAFTITQTLTTPPRTPVSTPKNQTPTTLTPSLPPLVNVAAPVVPTVPSSAAFAPPLRVTFRLDTADPALQKQTYDVVKNKLNGRTDLNVIFDDKNMTVTFLHHLHEIQAIISKENLKQEFASDLSVVQSQARNPKFMGRARAARRVNLFGGKSIFKVADTVNSDFQAREKRLLAEAKAFLDKRPSQQIAVGNKITTAQEIIPSLLKPYKGICIGEIHKHASPKQWIITHMRRMKNEGVNILFLEHLFHDSMQVLLDQYLAAPTTAPLPPSLEAYLEQLDEGHIDHPQFNFKHLVIAAKRAKIRVVGIDTTVSYYCGASDTQGIIDNEKRFAAMNYVAVQIIEDELKKHPGKFIALMGSGHVSTCSGVKGVAELLECPSLIIEDGRQEAIACNVKNLFGEIAHATCYVTQTV